MASINLGSHLSRMPQAMAKAPAKGLSSLRYKKLLLVCKKSKLRRFQQMNLITPYVEQNYKGQLIEQHDQHHAVIDTFKQFAEKMGKEVIQKCETEATAKDMEGVDLVVALGGDQTFLRASALIWDRTPILGINTNRNVYSGVLNPHFIDYEKKDRHTELILETSEDDHSIGYEKRSRLLFEYQPQSSEMEPQQVLVLNETFCAEHDVSSASRYCIKKDGIDLGVFKSSGLIVSTGTGSSGWLYAARQLTSQQLTDVQRLLGSLDVDANTNDRLADELSNETIFPRDDPRMYFCVREGFALTKMSEGFCKHINITSEMLNGEVIIDNWFKMSLCIGDQFSLHVSKQNMLRALSLEI